MGLSLPWQQGLRVTFEMALNGTDIVVLEKDGTRVEFMPNKFREHLTEPDWQVMLQWAKPFWNRADKRHNRAGN